MAASASSATDFRGGSGSSTMTMEAPSHPRVIHITLRRAELSRQELFERLTSIIEKRLVHIEKDPSSDDPLSKKLLSWALEVLDNDFPDTSDQLYHHIAARVNDLYESLRNPLDGGPLRDPVIVHGWIWERSMLADYRETQATFGGGNTCPFTGAALPETPEPYSFGNELIELIQRVSERPADDHPEERIDASLSAAEKFSLYDGLIKCAKSIRRSEESLEMALGNSAELETIKASAHAEKSKLVESIQSLQATMNRAIDKIGQAHKAETTALKDVVTTLKEKISALEKDVRDLSRRVASLEAQNKSHRETIAHLRRRIDEMDGSDGCTVM